MNFIQLKKALQTRLSIVEMQLGQAQIALGRCANERAKDEPYWRAKIEDYKSEIAWITAVLEK